MTPVHSSVGGQGLSTNTAA